MDVRSFIGGFIDTHEVGSKDPLSLDPVDNGNWFDAGRYRRGLKQQRGSGNLVGSKYGVTGATLAEFYGDKPELVNARAIAALTREEAVTIGVELFYRRPHLDALPWNHVTAAVLDTMWMSGKVQGIKLLQRLVGANPDGKISPGGDTALRVNGYLRIHGEAQMAINFELAREAFYTSIATNDGAADPDRKYLKGWINRAKSFLPGLVWWRRW